MNNSDFQVCIHFFLATVLTFTGFGFFENLSADAQGFVSKYNTPLHLDIEMPPKTTRLNFRPSYPQLNPWNEVPAYNRPNEFNRLPEFNRVWLPPVMIEPAPLQQYNFPPAYNPLPAYNSPPAYNSVPAYNTIPQYNQSRLTPPRAQISVDDSR